MDEFKLVLTIIGGLSTAYALYAIVNKMIEKKISDESFLLKLASKIRPSIIFDFKGSVLIDQGGMAYIEAIEVIPGKESPLFPEKITIRPNRHLNHAPILTTLEADEFIPRIDRGSKFDWVYTLEYVAMWGSAEEERETTRFRLEIIP